MHAIFCMHQTSGECAGVCTCDRTHQMDKTESCVLAGSKGTHFDCVCSTHQNAVAGWCNDLVLHIKRLDQEDLQSWKQLIHDAFEWILSWHCSFERISWLVTP